MLKIICLMFLVLTTKRERQQRDTCSFLVHIPDYVNKDVKADWYIKSHLVVKHNPGKQRQGNGIDFVSHK